MDFETLNELSYREIQAQAKSLQIAANQKKEILIHLILESQNATATDSAVEQSDKKTISQEHTESVEVCVESAVEEAVEETVVEVAEPDMETAMEDTGEVTETEASTLEIELDDIEAAGEDVAADVVEESAEPVAAEMSMLEASFIGEVLLEDEECDVDFEVDAHFGEEGEETEEDEGYWVEEEEEEVAEEGEEELTEMLSDMKLRGLPTPQGKKTVFDCEQTEGAADKINWGIDFSEEQQQQEQDYENCSPQKRNTPFKVGGAGATPKGKHTVFASPELQVGSAVHWEYAAYQAAAASFESPVQSEPEQPCAPLASDLLLHAMTPGKALRTKEDQMAFWLAKGPKTPMAPKTPMR